MDIVELTARLGLEPHEQSAVLAWTNETLDHEWTEREADELADVWSADIERWRHDTGAMGEGA